MSKFDKIFETRNDMPSAPPSARNETNIRSKKAKGESNTNTLQSKDTNNKIRHVPRRSSKDQPFDNTKKQVP